MAPIGIRKPTGCDLIQQAGLKKVGGWPVTGYLLHTIKSHSTQIEKVPHRAHLGHLAIRSRQEHLEGSRDVGPFRSATTVPLSRLNAFLLGNTSDAAR